MGLNIIQVVGYQNSGKTTLVSKLIRRCSDLGLHVVSLKHHGHGDLSSNASMKDTDRHRLSGSLLTGLATDNQLELTLSNSNHLSLDNILKLYDQFIDFDVLVIEGYKKAHYPKVVLLRNYNDRHLLEEVTNLICAIAWTDADRLKQWTHVPVYHIDDQEFYINTLIERIGELNNG